MQNNNMKKLAFLSILALCVGFTSCDSYEEPNPPAQSNPAEPVFNIAGFSSEAATPASELVALDSVSAVQIASFTANLPEGYNLEVATILGSDSTFTRSTYVATAVNTVEAAGSLKHVAEIASADFETALVSVVGKNPAEKTMWVKCEAYAVKDATKVRLGGPETVYGPYSLRILPMDLGVVIEEAYYLVGTACEWDAKQAIKLEHSNLNPYDDPVFYQVFDVNGADGGWWWKIIPQSTYESESGWEGAQYGVEENGDTSLAGMLIDNSKGEPGAGCLDVTGPYMLKINMLDGTYEYTLAIEKLWTPGGGNGWNFDYAQVLTTSDYIEYSGVVHIDGEFKLTIQPNWEGAVDYGGADGVLVEGGNITDGYANGLYWVVVNLTEMTYKVTPITTIGVVGNFNSWAGDAALTPSADFLTWTGKVTLDGGGFKFRANGGWDINWGGSFDNLTQGGGDLSIEAGTYDVTLDLSKVPYSCTLTLATR